MSTADSTHDLCPQQVLPWWQAWLEIGLVFVVIFLHGAWPTPDVNETDYTTKAVHFWNHDAFAHDFFNNTADAHAVYYLTFGWLSTLGCSLDTMAWIGRIFTWLMLAIAWRGLSYKLLPKLWLAGLSVELFVLMSEHTQAGGEWIVGGVEAKGFAWALVLWALHALVCGRWNLVWLLLGAATSLHVVIGGWAGVCLGMVWLLSGRDRISIIAMLPGLGGSFLLALPGLWLGIKMDQGVDWQTVQQANTIQVFERLPHHLLPSAFALGHIFRHILMWVAFWLLCNAVPANENERRLRRFITAAILLAVAGFVLGAVAKVAPQFAASLLRFYWSRLSDILVPLGAGLVGLQWALGQLPVRKNAARWVLIVLFGLLAFDLFKQISHLPWLPKPVPTRSDSMMVYDDWRDVCRWIAADDHTLPDTLFITPRNANTFKWYTGRAEVGTWKDMPQDARSVVEWWQRMNELFGTDSKKPEDRWHDSAAELGDLRLHELAQKYGAQYAVIELTPGVPRLAMRPIYENKSYAVYRLEPGHN